ncbi:MAG: M48 family metallopeptidase [Armatimonadota bacterium]
MSRVFRWCLVTLIVACLPFLLGAGGCDGGGILSIGEEQEIAIGKQAAVDIEREFTVLPNDPGAARVERLGRKIAAGSERPNLPWTFKVVDEKAPNAFALPGGPIYVTKGLLDMQVTDDELAGVLAHEVAHINQRHSAKRIEQALTIAIVSDIALQRADNMTRAAVGLAVQFGIELPHSRAAEYEADALGIRLAYNAGTGAMGLVDFLKRLDAMPDAPKSPEWMQSHPATKARIERTTKMVAEVTALQRPVPIELSAYDKKVIKGLPADK